MADIANVQRLLKKLSVLPAAMREQIKVAMAEQADEIVAMMKRLAPVDSGDLRDSIGWVWGTKAPRGSVSVASVGAKALAGLNITIFAGNEKAFYAKFVEFGTNAHKAGGKFKGATIPAIPAKPYFFVSWRASRKGARNKMRAAVRKVVKQVAAQG